MINFLLGAIAIAELTVALVFLRFWRRTRDILFVFFATAFGLSGLSRICMFMTDPQDEGGTLVYIIRLIAFGLILFAILNKNRTRRRS